MLRITSALSLLPRLRRRVVFSRPPFMLLHSAWIARGRTRDADMKILSETFPKARSIPQRYNKWTNEKFGGLSHRRGGQSAEMSRARFIFVRYTYEHFDRNYFQQRLTRHVFGGSQRALASPSRFRQISNMYPFHFTYREYVLVQL